MKSIIFSLFFSIICLTNTLSGYCQDKIMVSVPAQVKLKGNQPYFLIGNDCFLVYRMDSTELSLYINFNSLKEPTYMPVPPNEISYHDIVQDTNYFCFKGKVKWNTIRPSTQIEDTYTFSVSGTVTYKQNTYPVLVSCQQGVTMTQSANAANIDLKLDLEKMSPPVYISSLSAWIDELNITLTDAFVNKFQ